MKLLWIAKGVVTLTVFMTFVGCVSQRQVDDLQTLYRRSQEQIIDLQAQLEEKQAQIEVLKAHAQDPQMLSSLEAAIAERDKLAKALAAAEDQLRAIGAGPILDPELDSALMELAKSNPALMTYDPALGMVKFQSDLTFDLGSAEVSQQAVPSLNQLAQILKTPVAMKYEARIVGHTDNVRIGRPATRAQHPTNWHLSVHRAIAVKDVLARAGVPDDRMGVAGYGEYRPIAPNTAKGNQANRRVEIYLVRNAYSGGVQASASPSPSPTPAITPPSDGQQTMKEEPPHMFK